MFTVDEVLKNVKNVGITGHVRPDGDCVGSTLALYTYIKDNYSNIEPDIYLGDFGKEFNFLKYTDEIKHEPDPSKKYDVFFILDCGNPERTGDMAVMIDNAARTVCIDHHVKNGEFADLNCIRTGISSASEVLYELLDPDKINKNIAECIYTGIIHDTGVLKYQSTSLRTMEIAGIMMDKGIDFTNIIDDTFYRKTMAQNKALGQALLKSKLYLNGKVIFSTLNSREMKDLCVTGKDLGGIIDQLRFTEGVEVAVFIYQLENGEYKASLRSINIVDVNKIANEFGGGGHIKAAGFSTDNEPDKVIEDICALVSAQM